MSKQAKELELSAWLNKVDLSIKPISAPTISPRPPVNDALLAQSQLSPNNSSALRRMTWPPTARQGLTLPNWLHLRFRSTARETLLDEGMHG